MFNVKKTWMKLSTYNKEIYIGGAITKGVAPTEFWIGL